MHAKTELNLDAESENSMLGFCLSTLTLIFSLLIVVSYFLTTAIVYATVKIIEYLGDEDELDWHD